MQKEDLGPFSIGLKLKEALNFQGQIYIGVWQGPDCKSHVIATLKVKCFPIN